MTASQFWLTYPCIIDCLSGSSYRTDERHDSRLGQPKFENREFALSVFGRQSSYRQRLQKRLFRLGDVLEFHSSQLSKLKAGTRSNSRVFAVTRVRFRAKAWAAISKSLGGSSLLQVGTNCGVVLIYRWGKWQNW